jgi:tRNA 2-thiouridine synthesizing protein A
VLILADDPIAPAEIAALAAAQAWMVTPVDDEPGWIVTSTKV